MREGFWRQSQDATDDLPWPVPEPRWPHKEEVTCRLIKAERVARSQTYRGLSMCRLCGCFNGSREYTLDNPNTGESATWPEGLMHYIVAHKVPVSDEFYTFLANHPAF